MKIQGRSRALGPLHWPLHTPSPCLEKASKGLAASGLSVAVVNPMVGKQSLITRRFVLCFGFSCLLISRLYILKIMKAVRLQTSKPDMVHQLC